MRSYEPFLDFILASFLRYIHWYANKCSMNFRLKNNNNTWTNIQNEYNLQIDFAELIFFFYIQSTRIGISMSKLHEKWQEYYSPICEFIRNVHCHHFIQWIKFRTELKTASKNLQKSNRKMPCVRSWGELMKKKALCGRFRNLHLFFFQASEPFSSYFTHDWLYSDVY